MHERAQYLVDTLGMRQHPAGGYYGEIYRSRLSVRRDHPDSAALLRTQLGDWVELL